MNTRLSILVRCGSGLKAGLGHVVRMMTLAKVLQERHDAGVRFLCDPNPVGEREMERAGLPFSLNHNGLSEEASIEQALDDAGVLILDNKFPYSSDFICQVRNRSRVVMVDHACDGMFEANLTVFPVADLKAEVIQDPRWRTAHGPMLHGPEFVIVSPEILALSKNNLRCNGSFRKDEQGHLIVTTGGSDPRGVLITITPWLARLPFSGEIRVLVGKGFAWRDELARLKKQVPEHIRILSYSPEHFREAFLAVCTFGVTTYELMFLGIPSLVIGHSPENALASQTLTEKCCATVDLGLIDELTEERFANAFMSLVRDRGQQAALAERGAQLIDGLGAERVAERVLGIVGGAN